MPFLVILKRFEVWLLFAILAALFVVALQPPPSLPVLAAENSEIPRKSVTPSRIRATGTQPSETGAPAPSLAVREVRVIRSSPGYIVETLIGGGTASDSDLVLDENNVRATTADGQPVNRFFEPFRESPILHASGDSIAALRWWLPAPAESLWIEIAGERIEANLP